jgi:hypothetical protein
MKKSSYTTKANRFLSISLFSFAICIKMFYDFLKESEISQWYWVYFSNVILFLFIGTFALGEYRHFKRLE